ncbi:GNAT family N-acetyltransferase [Glutamicibacter sp. MCAF14]|uniref:GNAT family N-acetyltransferase n=1 Tax=Glutamicibacter sp. MCAF14 TaxID=3233043 RepID=UPI003F8F8DBC
MDRAQQISFLESSPQAAGLPPTVLGMLIEDVESVHQRRQWQDDPSNPAYMARASAKNGDSFVLASVFYSEAISGHEFEAERVALLLAKDLAQELGITALRRNIPSHAKSLQQACKAHYNKVNQVHRYELAAGTHDCSSASDMVDPIQLEDGLKAYNLCIVDDPLADSIDYARLTSMIGSSFGTAIGYRSAQGGYAGIGLFVVDEESVRIAAIAVAPGYRGQGIGASLIQSASKEFAGRTLQSDVMDTNAPSLALHRSLGFSKVSHLYTSFAKSLSD